MTAGTQRVRGRDGAGARSISSNVLLGILLVPLASACSVTRTASPVLPVSDGLPIAAHGSPAAGWHERLPAPAAHPQDRPAYATNPRGGRTDYIEREAVPQPGRDGGDWQRRPYRRRRGPSGFASISFSRGDYDFDDDALGREDTDATYFRFRGGLVGNGGTGGGIDVKVFSLDDNFYAGSQDETSADHFDVYLHMLAHPTAGTFRMPVRIGPYLSWTAARFEDTRDYTDYISIGLRFEVQPEVVLLQDEGGSEVSLFGRFAGGVHGTTIRDQSTDEDYDSSGTTLGLEAGVRFTFGNASVAASYIYHENVTRESDGRRFGNDVLVIPRLETEFDGFVITFGVGF